MVERVEREVKEVIDGDTFEVSEAINGFVRIRIADHDAEEQHEPKGPKETEFLRGLIERKVVVIEHENKVNFERLVADVFIDGKNVGELLKKMQQQSGGGE